MAKRLPKAKILKGRKPKANDTYEGFEDELALAELIQNAAACGLSSVWWALLLVTVRPRARTATPRGTHG